MTGEGIYLGRWLGLAVYLRGSALAALIAGALVLTWLASEVATDLTLAAAALGSTLVMVLHLLAGAVHQGGRALLARRAGYPLAGFAYWNFLTRSLFPPDEGEVPGRAQARRALGGLLASLLLGVAAALLAFLISPHGGVASWVSSWFAVDCANFFFVSFFSSDGPLLAERWYSRGRAPAAPDKASRPRKGDRDRER